MRCKTCDYRLWNLRSRLCPECGTPFLPSEQEFVPHSVQFCCPHCAQPYYGTGPTGHIEPRAFNCVTCGHYVDMDEMILLPTAGLEEEQTRVERLPWLDRSDSSLFKAWFSTVGMAMVRPHRLMDLVPIEGALGAAWRFAMFSHGLILCVTILPWLFFPLVLTPPGMRGPGLLGMFAGIGVGVAGTILGVLLFLAIWGMVAHGLLRLTGRTAAGIGRTYQALCYSSGANVLMMIPCLGIYFGWLWGLVSAIVLIAYGQRVHGLRATVAVLVLPLVLIGGFIGFTVWSTTRAFSTIGGMTTNEITVVTDAVNGYASTNGYAGPAHAAELITTGHLLPQDFVAPVMGRTIQTVPLADTTLSGFAGLSPERQEEVVLAAAEALPKDAVAHRLGDFVFTYHQVRLDQCDPDVWIVILTPETGARAGNWPIISVGTAGGLAYDFHRSRLPQELADQNKLRAKEGLPPLPDPTTVKHIKPATTTAESH